MFYFCIPLISKAASKNWEVVTELFNRTLWSCYNQTNKNFKILIACHDIPILNHVYDERVEFLIVDSAIPTTQHEKMIDKGYKTHTLAMKVRELGAGYAMLVDADDLVSNRIVQYVYNNPTNSGYYVKTGYAYFIGTKYFKVLKKFSSGTAFIIHYNIDELPNEYPLVMTDNNKNEKCLMRKRHGDILEACVELNKPLKPLPFKGAVYVLGTGENHSLYGKKTKYQTYFRTIIQFFNRKIYLKNKHKKEFSIDWLDDYIS